MSRRSGDARRYSSFGDIVEIAHKSSTRGEAPLDPPAAAELARREQRRHEALERARALIAGGQWALATSFFRAALVEASDDVEALRGLGLAALHAGHAAEALSWLQRAHHLSPYDVALLTELGLAQKRAGRLEDAIASYRRALALSARDPGLLVNLGRAEREAGRPRSAVLSFRRALEVDPAAPEVWSMLSNVLREAGRAGEALDAARRALSIDPWHAEAHLNEGAALHSAGAPGDAVISYLIAANDERCRPRALANLKIALRSPGVAERHATALVLRQLTRPGDALGLLELARALRTQRPASALRCFELALGLTQDALAERELASLLWELGRVQPALSRLLRAIASDRTDVAAYRQLAEWLGVPNKISLESPAWQRLLSECPPDVTCLSNLGVALRRRGFPIQAARLHRRALALDPRRPATLVNLGAALSSQGDVTGAIATYREALELEPRHWDAASNLLFSLHLDPAASPELILDEHRRVGERLGASVTACAARHAPEPLDGRRLRIGYVSPDFRSHPVAHFLEPVLRAHDHRRVELFCYSDVEHPDEVTTRLSRLADRFVPCAGWTHERLSAQIESDHVDVLVDLAGHTGRNRLPVFAARPSPLQVAWLGYFDTTGLSAIDARIADAASVPASAERFFVERVLRLPRSANCFLPPPGPEPSPPPCAESGVITFGCFNNPAKIGRGVVETFARVLHAAPRSQIRLKYLAFNEAELCERYRAWFAEEGITAERVLFEGPSSLEGFLQSYARIDIALDPFPYSGETTALHTLWMGVPLVALEGPTLVQRLASRVLRVAGCDEWVARDRDHYVAIAAQLAGDTARLGHARRTLRERLRASPLLDHAGVTRELEDALLGLWRERCASTRGG